MPILATKPILSVITPTYNRAHLLTRAYESLKLQSNKSFEWIIIDDGSTDDTQKIISLWSSESNFKIRYHYQENCGKPSAYNHAVRLAEGEYLTCMDSDDWLPEDGVEQRIYLMQKYDAIEGICGITGLCQSPEGTVVGARFPDEGMIGSKQYLGRIAPGDKSTTFKTSILRRFPFPVYPGEKFLPESIVYNRMFSAGYSFVSTNDFLSVVDYQKGGLSDRNLEIRHASLNGTIMYYHEMSLISFPTLTILRAQSNLVRYSLHKLGLAKLVLLLILYIPAIALGISIYINDSLNKKPNSH